MNHDNPIPEFALQVPTPLSCLYCFKVMPVTFKRGTLQVEHGAEEAWVIEAFGEAEMIMGFCPDNAKVWRLVDGVWNEIPYYDA